jgi:hypothetical protein|nr:MAG TPA: hypothetical protein [Bacteriophage sp.]
MEIIIDTDNLEALKYKTEDVPILIKTFQQLINKLMYEVIGNYYSIDDVPESAPKWVKEELLNVEKTCYMDGYINKEYVFKGIQETFEDYYYILENNNKQISYSSCVGKIYYK